MYERCKVKGYKMSYIISREYLRSMCVLQGRPMSNSFREPEQMLLGLPPALKTPTHPALQP